MSMTIDPNNIDIGREDKKTLVALVKFALNFTSYVREVDPVLWKRASEYAADFTKEQGISFTREEGDLK
jgi:hypothetical protein